MPTIADDAGNLAVPLRVFRPTSATTNLAVTAASQAVTLGESVNTTRAGRSARLVNSGNQVVFINFDGTAATVAASMPILPGTVEMFTLNKGDSLTAIAPATGSTLYASVGEGA